MTPRSRHVLSTFLGAALLSLLLLLMSLDDLYQPKPPQTIEPRKVELYVPPPPPPPAPSAGQDSARDPGPPLTLVSRESEIPLEVMELDVEPPPGGPGNLGLGSGTLGEAPGAGLATGAELDDYPTVLSSPLFAYPEELIEKQIYEFTVVFDILIYEDGTAYPIEILKNPYPEYNQELWDYAAHVRFSQPLKLGIPVRTEYLWPVLFKRK